MRRLHDAGELPGEPSPSVVRFIGIPQVVSRFVQSEHAIGQDPKEAPVPRQRFSHRRVTKVANHRLRRWRPSA